MTTDELMALADALGVTVASHVDGTKGWYEHRTRTVSVRRDLAAANLRCTLAHELAHAMAGDEPTGIPWLDDRMEDRADERAARLLISPAEYALAERLVGPHPGALARELGVTLHVLETWQSLYERQAS